MTYLDIEPSAPLSNTPGTVELAFGMSTTCGNAACSTNGPGLRAFFSGQLVGVPYIAPPAAPTSVPTLNQWSLAGLSMLLAAWALLYRRCASSPDTKRSALILYPAQPASKPPRMPEDSP